MSRNFPDPIHTAAQREAQQRYLDSLFEPIDADLQAWPMSFIVEDFLPKGYLCVLASAPKEGKTCLATALALAVATGTPFAGMSTVQSSVLWLASEETRRERNLILSQSPLADPATPLYTCYERLPIDQEQSLELLMEWVNRTQAKLVVVDPLHAATSGRSLQDGWNARRSLQMFKQFFGHAGITGLILHHAKDLAKTRAYARVAENDQLAATASMNIVLTNQKARHPSPAGGGAGVGARQVCEAAAPYRLVHLHITGRGDFANRNLTLLSHAPLDYQVIEEMDQTEPKPMKLDFEEQRCADFIGKTPKHAGQIAVHMQMDDYRLRYLLTKLRQKGVIRLVDSPRRPRRYRLTAHFAKNRAEKIDSK